ncbi:MAG: preQ(1) synthase [Bacteroidota bacterium]|nr:preQ(1) synthase [Bacteroidota bacterium]MDP4234222.1 preQ(1) synthase [Bacteroidota bacterium]MDP4243412.1 preQ(1) synthase [Bacteroidota bacterium]MDP4288111.1 preQ(1) synthase [Bacteroidota bacterium]
MTSSKPELVVFPNPYPNREYVVTHTNPEFTSVCPVTGLPDFGEITIVFVPDKLCVELKALKYYFISFRNRGIFYEAVINEILEDLVSALDPRWLEVTGEFSTRGGLHSNVVAKYTKGESPVPISDRITITKLEKAIQ